MLAEAQERVGQIEAARSNYLKAFELDARVFRSLSLSIPVSIRADAGKGSRQAAAWLESSRRFRPGKAFVVEVRRTSEGLEAILEDPSGAVLGRAASSDARLLADEVHLKFFSPRINFEQADLRSLDSSPMSGAAQ